MTASASTAYMLISHGSRDPRPGQAMERLAQVVLTQIRQRQIVAEVQSPAVQVALTHRVQTNLKPDSGFPARATNPREDYRPSPSREQQNVPPVFPLVGTGCLELSPVPLHQQIIDFSRRAAAAGAKTIRVVPLFLLKGVHVMEDIPHEIEQAQEALAGLTVEVCPDLGSHPKLRQVLQSKRRVAGDGALLLLAHGSRRPGGNAKIHSLAEALGGTAAFWAVAPKLEDQVIQLMQAGRQQLIVLPYFLFPGKITDAITHAAEELAERFPQMTLRLLPPLGPTESLANLVTDLALDRVRPNTQTSTLTLNRTAFRHQLPPFMVS